MNFWSWFESVFVIKFELAILTWLPKIKDENFHINIYFAKIIKGTNQHS